MKKPIPNNFILNLGEYLEVEYLKTILPKDFMTKSEKVDILLVTATATETRAVINVAKNQIGLDPIPHECASRTFLNFGEVRGKNVHQLQVEMGTSGLGSSLETLATVIPIVNPEFIIMVGIAFGANRNNQKIGDVLVSKQLYQYNQIKVASDGKVIPRGDKPSSSAQLLSRFRATSTLQEFKFDVHFGLILSGEELIDCSNRLSELIQQEPEAIGGEMEGSGLYVAAQRNKKDWIVVKAICDWADGTKRVKKKSRQEKAALNSAELVWRTLNHIDWEPKGGGNPQDNELSSVELEIRDSQIKKYSTGFVGRKSIFDEVDQFIQNSDSGYFQITAEAGLGKTTLAAALARYYSAPVYFFSERDGKTQPEIAIKVLCAQVLEMYKLSSRSFQDNNNLNMDVFLQLLKQVQIKTQKRVIVIIDSIDESTPTGAGVNPMCLPGDLPNSVFIILLSRPGLKKIYSTVSHRELKIQNDDPMQLSDIQEFLFLQAQSQDVENIIHNAVPPILPDQFVKELSLRSNGNFMYLYFAIQDIKNSRPGSPIFLDQFPKGLNGYYSKIWEHIEEAKTKNTQVESWKNLYLPLILFLCAAKEPITVDWLSSLIGRDKEDIYEGLRQWQRFLKQTSLNGELRWHIVHQSFADFVSETYDLALTHEDIANHFDETRWDDHHGYALRHLCSHLSSVKSGAGYLLFSNLLFNHKWYKLKLSKDLTGFIYLDDFNQYWSKIENITYKNLSTISTISSISDEICCAIANSTFRNLSKSIPINLLKALIKENLIAASQALRWVEFNPDANERIKGLFSLSNFSLSYQDVQKISDQELGVYFKEMALIAKLKFFQGDLNVIASLVQDALKATDNISSIWLVEKIQAQLGLAKFLPLEEFKRLHDTLSEETMCYKNTITQVEALVRLAYELSKDDPKRLLILQKALEQAKKLNIDYHPGKVEAVELVIRFLELSQQKIELDNIKLEVSNIKDDQLRKKKFAVLIPYLSQSELIAFEPSEDYQVPYVSRLAELGDIDKALNKAQSIQDPYHQALAVTHILPKLDNEQIKINFIEQTFQLISKIERDDLLQHLINQLSEHLSKAELLRLLQIVQRINDTLTQEETVAMFCKQLAILGELDEANRIANTIQFYPLSVYIKTSFIQYLDLTKSIELTQEVLDEINKFEVSEYNKFIIYMSIFPEIPQSYQTKLLQQIYKTDPIDLTTSYTGGISGDFAAMNLDHQFERLFNYFLVQKEPQKADQILSQINEDDKRITLSILLLKQYPELQHLPQKVFNWIMQVNPKQRAWYMSELISLVEGDIKENAIIEGLNAAKENKSWIGGQRGMAVCLARLAYQVGDQEEKEKLLREALEWVQTITPQNAKETIWPRESSGLDDEDRQDAANATYIGRYLPLAHFFSKEKGMAVLKMTQNEIDTASLKSFRKDNLLKQLSLAFAQCGEFEHAIDVLQNVNYPHNQADVVKVLTALIPKENKGSLKTIYELSLRIDENLSRGNALFSFLANEKSPNQKTTTVEVLKAIQKAQPSVFRNELLEKLVPYLLQLTVQELYPHINATLHKSSEYIRKDLLDDLGVIAPVIAKLGGVDSVKKTITAIRQIGEMWK